MELFKFEKNIKAKLSKRELKVSKGAWDRLATELDAQEKKQASKKYSYLLVAASMVGILFMIMFYGTMRDNEVITDSVTVSPDFKKTKVIETKKERFIVEIPEIKEKEKHLVTKIAVPEKKHKTKNVVVASKESKIIVPAKALSFQEETSLTSTEDPTSEVTEEAFSQQAFSDSLVQEKATKLAILVASLEKENQEVTDAEIDALLEQAQEDIFAQKHYKQNKQTVDATALLLDVEAELDQSFKEQVFEALKTSFNKVRTVMGR